MGGNLVILAIFAFFALVLAVFTIASSHEWAVLYCLNRSGVVGIAKVIVVREDRRGRGTRRYARYRFNIGGRSYEREQQISKRHYKEFEHSKEVTIKYLPAMPSISRLGDEDFDNTYRNLSSYVAFAAVLVIPQTLLLWVACFALTTLFCFAVSIPQKQKRKRDEV